jgi:hypothetical protein
MQIVRDMVNDRSAEDDASAIGGVNVDEPYLTSNGVMMGDGGTKGLLTLFSLIAEAESRSEYPTVNLISEHYDPWDSSARLQQGQHESFTRRHQMLGFDSSQWDKELRMPHLYRIAGDDQGEFGSRKKLLRTSECQRMNQMIVSEDKDFISPVALLLCERMLIRTQYNRISADVTKSPYEETYMVDSLKMRLFSPYTKAQDGFNEPNPAIGKSKVLSKQLKELPSSWKQIASHLAPNRFLSRMMRFLPRDTKGSIDPIVYLPRQFGGFGLKQPDWNGIIGVLDSLSTEHCLLIQLLIEGSSDDRIQWVLESFMKDRFARGVKFEDKPIGFVLSELNMNLDPAPLELNATARREHIDLGEFTGFQAKKQRLKAVGYVTDRDLSQAYSRAVTQERLLTEKPEAGWTPADWPARRAAYEESIKHLLKLRECEGREDLFVGRDTLTMKLLLLSQSDLEKITFNEAIFYKRYASCLRFLHEENEEDVEYVTQPVHQILNALSKLDLPPINDKGWYPKELDETDWL